MRRSECIQISKCGCQEDGARLFTGAQCQDKRQLAKTETRGVPSKYEESFFAVLVTDQSSCGVSFSRGMENLPEHGSVQPSIGALATEMDSRDLSQPQLFCKSYQIFAFL